MGVASPWASSRTRAWCDSGWNGSLFSGQPSIAGIHSSRNCTSERNRRVFACPRRPSRMKACRDRIAVAICGPPAGWSSWRTLGSTPSRSRVWTARLVALAADVVQIALLPLVLGGAISPVNDLIDVVTAVVLTVLVGWHWAFLPAFVAEIVPF